MDQGSHSQNKNEGFSLQKQIYVILGILLVAVIVFFATRGIGEQNEQTTDNQTNTETTDNSGNNGQNPTPGGQQGNTNSGQVAGNFTATGTLKTSDNSSRGNYMVEGSSGKIYVSTSRDFSSLLNQNVTLNADGNINSFRFLGFNNQVSAPSNNNQPDVGGAPDEEVTETRNFTFSGTLQKSSSSLGNYMITSEDSRVYLQSSRDYSAWIGSTVTLSATGSFDSFSNAILTK